jgi:hypothetical protein
MYLQKVPVISRTNFLNKYFFVGILTVNDENSRAGFISQSHGIADPDPDPDPHQMSWIRNTEELYVWDLRVHTEWRLPISGVHPIMMEKSAPFSLLPSRTKLQCTLQLGRQIHCLAISSLYPKCTLCVGYYQCCGSGSCPSGSELFQHTAPHLAR